MKIDSQTKIFPASYFLYNQINLVTGYSHNIVKSKGKRRELAEAEIEHNNRIEQLE